MKKDHSAKPLWIGEFRFDEGSQRLWHNDEAIELVPQAWAVLACLVERAGQLVSKEEILRLAWPGVAVSDMALSQTIRRLRTAFGDDARSPRYVETVHRRGFRLIAPVRLESIESRSVPTIFVGRKSERRRLAELFRAAHADARQIVFIEGEAGIGKTALVRSFLAELGEGVRVADAQCVEQLGAAEPYMPMLEALERLARSDADTLEVLHRYAPSWLAMMPWLLPPGEARGLEGSVTDATRARMLREMARALEVVSAERPLVLLLEDLHWADRATIDLLGSITRRPDPARLMILGTYRPAEAIAYEHPIVGLARALWPIAACTRLSLDSFGPDEVGEYLSRRFSAPEIVEPLAERIHGRTEGNALFLAAVVDHLVERRFFEQTAAGGWRLTRPIEDDDLRSIPKSVREMIDLQLASLAPSDLELVQAASVGAVAFRSASIAAALERPGAEGIESVENACDRLIERWHLLVSAGPQSWPDGTRTQRYRFRHDLYRQVLYDGVPSSRRSRYHRRIGERLERGFDPDLVRVAGELVYHFGRSGDDDRTVTYSLLAAEQARRRYAIHEAANYLCDALRHLENLPAGADRDLKELQLRTNLLLARTYTQLGHKEEEDRNFSRIETLAGLPSAGRDVLSIQSTLVHIYCLRSLPVRAEPIARRLAQLATAGVASEEMDALSAIGGFSMMLGRFAEAAGASARALELFGETDPPACAGFAGYESKWREVGATLRVQLGTAKFFCGSFDEAVAHLERAIELCEGPIRPYWASAALSRAAGIYCLRGDLALARRISDRAVAIAEDNSIVHQVHAIGAQRAWLAIMRGEAEDALDSIRSGWEDYVASRCFIPTPIGPLFLLDACRAVGAAAEGLRMADEVWRATRSNGVRWYDAELVRLRGELVLLGGGRDVRTEAKACFQRALEIAHAQEARLYELRAATSLARLARSGKDGEAARAKLEGIYARFTNGLEMPDMRIAAECLRA